MPVVVLVGRVLPWQLEVIELVVEFSQAEKAVKVVCVMALLVVDLDLNSVHV